MVRGIVQVVAGLLVVGGVLWIGFTLSFRTKFAPVQNVIRRLNRKVTNPRVLKSAGQPGADASVVQHVGRSSGAAYRTPAVAVPVDDGFLFALPYGPDADWVRNVLAAGSASIEHEGRTIQVQRPELVPGRDANPLFPAKEQRMHRLYGVDDFLLVHRSQEAAGISRARNGRGS